MILLSLIIPVLHLDLHLPLLFKSIAKFSSTELEIIVVNQSDGELPDYLTREVCIPIIDHITDTIVSAANARNLGASLASGEYVFFLDDDALFYSDEIAFKGLLSELHSGPDVLVVQRGEIVDGKFISHWPKGVLTVTYRNFPRIIIEWNLIIKKSIFNKLGGFPEIGSGSPHAALSGEAFVLASKIVAINLAILLWPSVQIAHPGLFEKIKPVSVALGYSYGAGYAVGLSLPSFDLKMKIYWVFRVMGASLSDLFLRKGELIFTIEKVDKLKYRFGLAKCKLYGFFSAMINKSPKPLAWLEHEASKIIPRYKN